MPRQHAINKKALGIYLTREEHAQLKAIAKARGDITVTEVIRSYLRELRLAEETKHTNKHTTQERP